MIIELKNTTSVYLNLFKYKFSNIDIYLSYSGRPVGKILKKHDDLSIEIQGDIRALKIIGEMASFDNLTISTPHDLFIEAPLVIDKKLEVNCKKLHLSKTLIAEHFCLKLDNYLQTKTWLSNVEGYSEAMACSH